MIFSIINRILVFFLICLFPFYSYAISTCGQINTIFPSNNKEVILTPNTKIDDELESNVMQLSPTECYLPGFIPSNADLNELELYLEPVNPINTSLATYAALADNQIGIGLRVSDLSYDTQYKGWRIGTVELDYAGTYKLVNFNINNKYWAWHKVKDFNPGIYRVATIRNLVKVSAYDGHTKVAEYPVSSLLSFDFIINNNSCSFDNTSVVRTLSTINRSAFTGLNVVAGYVDVPVSITCTPDTNYTIKLRAVDPINYITEHLVSGNNLQMTGSSSGVGIELLYKNTAIKKVNELYSINKDDLPTPTGQSSEILPFGAQYFQINESVTIGDITSYFILDIDYN
ncbi:fimbrial protein [Yokenella regensburgei]|uniref:fimbrial protein n=1 Tax=Yokenella regensburgei TaxID=158877 RepID=UPI0013755043|nr:type 1 fimbrial protein [Yokenella regensburgei]KAF1366709.1 type 1 fimbria pilin [Yokenella regensburgei]